MSEEKISLEREVKEIIGNIFLENVPFEKLSEEYLKRRKKERYDLKKYLDLKTKEDEDGIKVKIVKIIVKDKVTFEPQVYLTTPQGKTKDWIGIDVIVQDNNNGESAFFISFQPFYLDKETYNLHIIMDRIGLYLYHDKYLENYNSQKKIKPKTKTGPLKTVNGFLEMELLENIQLPLDGNKKDYIWTEIKKRHKDKYNKSHSNLTKEMIINIVKNLDENTVNKKEFITELIEELNKELED